MIMKKPEIDVIRFECGDIVAASSKTVSISGIKNYGANDNYISFNNKDYLLTSSNMTDMRKDLASYFEDDSLTSGSNGTIKFGSNGLNSVVDAATSRDGWDGTYKYDGNKVFTKIS